MKRKIIIILAIAILAIMVSLPTNAVGVSYNHASIPPDMSEEDMTISILEFSNGYRDEFPREITASDIDFSKAYKIYVDVDIFGINTYDYSQMLDILNKTSSIIYEVPICFENGDIYVANIQRCLPLRESAREVMTNEEVDLYEQTVGKWVVSAMFQFLSAETPFLGDYLETVKKSIPTFDGEMALIGSLPYFRDVVAVIPNENGEIERLIPLRPYPGLWNYLGDFKDEFMQNGWIDYVMVKDYINKHPQITNSDYAGGISIQPGVTSVTDEVSPGNAYVWIIPIAAICVVLSCLAVAAKLKAKRHPSNRTQ